MEKAHKYECANWFNDYSSQRYPKYLTLPTKDNTSKEGVLRRL